MLSTLDEKQHRKCLKCTQVGTSKCSANSVKYRCTYAKCTSHLITKKPWDLKMHAIQHNRVYSLNYYTVITLSFFSPYEVQRIYHVHGECFVWVINVHALYWVICEPLNSSGFQAYNNRKKGFICIDFANIYKCYIWGFSSVAAPIALLLKGNALCTTWTQQVLQILKQLPAFSNTTFI